MTATTLPIDPYTCSDDALRALEAELWAEADPFTLALDDGLPSTVELAPEELEQLHAECAAMEIAELED